ncbi:MAG: tRNA pseudouridine(38-40) synthase TruA [Anaerovoracaceae bacterium]
MERNILLTIEYDGTNFFGWQRQPNVPTVQREVERVLSILCKQDVLINGTSRTDAGVHAYGQRASFKGEFGIPTDRIMFAANNLMDGAVRIKEVEEVPIDFHARYDSKGKTYLYKIANKRYKDPFDRNYKYTVTSSLDFEAMKAAAKHIVGTHDFKCFEAAGGDVRESTVRTIYSLELKKEGDDILLYVKGDGFLYNMVRIITGTLVDVGLGKINADSLVDIINSKDRGRAGHTAPPNGLYLVEIYY